MNTRVMDELRHDNQIYNIVLWTDSTTVLHYTRNHDKRYKIFVANRLATIHAHSTVSQWRYVTTRRVESILILEGRNLTKTL